MSMFFKCCFCLDFADVFMNELDILCINPHISHYMSSVEAGDEYTTLTTVSPWVTADAISIAVTMQIHSSHVHAHTHYECIT